MALKLTLNDENVFEVDLEPDNEHATACVIYVYSTVLKLYYA